MGVPSTFADISQFNATFEVSEQKAGYIPELSYGSHIFQDLVEAEILYTAIFEGSSTRRFQPDRLRAMPNTLDKYIEDAAKLRDVMYVCEVINRGFTLYYDMVSERLLITNGAAKKEQ